jgi:aryl-alcohol dehydrogenase-like predicted oxidoreductase
MVNVSKDGVKSGGGTPPLGGSIAKMNTSSSVSVIGAAAVPTTSPVPASKTNVATKIPYVTLGQSGLRVSRLGLGSFLTFQNQFGAEKAYLLMRRAYALGINFFDNAEVYAKGGSERVMGDAVARGMADSVWSRGDLVICTKLFYGTREGPNQKGLSRKHILEGLRASLGRLKMEYVDIVMAHRPDPDTPMEETVRAFAHVIDKGQALYWGTSEWSALEISQACSIADKLGLPRPITEQPEYNVFSRQRVEVLYFSSLLSHIPLISITFNRTIMRSSLQVEYAALGATLGGIGITTGAPLASGILTGKYSNGKVPEGSRLAVASYSRLKAAKLEGEDAWQVDAADALKPVAHIVGCTLPQLAIAWCLKNQAVSTVILGATSTAQLEENVGAIAYLEKLDPVVMAGINAQSTRGATASSAATRARSRTRGSSS